MNWKEYQEEAFKTNADLGDLNLNNTHMVFGMATEAGEIIDVFKKNMAYGKEIDWKNVKEEIGDLAWYIAGFAYHNNMTLTDDKYRTDLETNAVLMDILTDIGMISSMIPNQSQTENIHTTSLLNFLLENVMTFCGNESIDFYRVLENNIEKLQTRYPNKFTKESALIRDLDAEAETLDE